MTPTDRPSKLEAFLAFLKDGWVTVYVDARKPGVSVPPHLQTESRLVLQYGLNMPVPVDDLEVTEAGIKATLSFSRQPHTTLIPWAAVYVIACTDGRGVLYQEDVPNELLTPEASGELPDNGGGQNLTSVAPEPSTTDLGSPPREEPPQPEAPRSRLKSIPMPQEEPDSVADDAAPTDAASRHTPEGENVERDRPGGSDNPGGGDKPRPRPTLRLVK